jgi:hypothetical protein
MTSHNLGHLMATIKYATHRPGVNFTNILRAAFAPVFLRQKSKNLKSKYKKALCETVVRKSRAYNVGEMTSVFQGLRLNVGKSDELTIEDSLFITFEVSNISKASGPVAQVNLTPDQNLKSFP